MKTKKNNSINELHLKYRGKPKKYADGGSVRRPAAAPTVRPFDPDYIERLAAQAIGYAYGGLATLDQKYADGGTVRAPKEMTIRGQEHELAYITPSEAELLKYFGGSGRMTSEGIRAYDDGGDGGDGGGGGGGDGGDGGGDGPGGGDSSGHGGGDGSNQADGMGGPGVGATGPDTSGMSEAIGMGFGPESPGYGPEAFGPGPDATADDDDTTEAPQDPDVTTISSPTAPFGTQGFGQAPSALGMGVIGTMAGLGLGVPGLGMIGTAIGTGLDVKGLNEQLETMGLAPSVSYGPAVANAMSFGALGQSAANQFGQALGFDALAEAPMSAFSAPQGLPDAPPDTSGGPSVVPVIQPVAGASTLQPALASLNQSYSEQLAPAYKAWDWAQIQRDAAANNMTLDAYVARNLGNLSANAPRIMKEGGAVTKDKSLEELHRRYAEGGDVRAPAGQIAEYDPEEIDRIARQIHLRFPEDDMPRTTYDEVESPTDLITRARLLMRGQNVGMPRRVGMGDGNDVMSSSTGLMELPLEDDRYGMSQRMLSTGINAMLDAERNAGVGLGLTALERPGERGFTGYGPQISASYGPASVYGGYQSITPNVPGAKSQGSYMYGGNLRIPLDEEGTAANIGANIMAGRRGQMGMGSAGTQITGSLERPFLGGRLGLDVSVDPSLRQREILLGYRRAF